MWDVAKEKKDLIGSVVIFALSLWTFLYMLGLDPGWTLAAFWLLVVVGAVPFGAYSEYSANRKAFIVPAVPITKEQVWKTLAFKQGQMYDHGGMYAPHRIVEYRVAYRIMNGILFLCTIGWAFLGPWDPPEYCGQSFAVGLAAMNWFAAGDVYANGHFMLEDPGIPYITPNFGVWLSSEQTEILKNRIEEIREEDRKFLDPDYNPVIELHEPNRSRKLDV